MSSVKNKGTKPEILFRKALFKAGYRYRINYKRLPGSPDIVLPKYKTVIFIHGCYWHGHKLCKRQIKPKSNVNFWEHKIETNRERDSRNYSELEKKGWYVIIIWACEIDSQKKLKKKLENVIVNLNEKT